MPPRIELANQRFGKLTVLKRVAKTHPHETFKWLCLCDCGKEKAISQSHLIQNKIVSCGCLLHRTGKKHPNSKYIGDISGDRWANIRRMAKYRPSRIDIEFTITAEDIWELFVTQKATCALTGIPLKIGAQRKDETTASLDRIDPTKGYTLDNVQWVHKDINYMKNVYDQNYFIEMCHKVATHKPLTKLSAT